MKDLSRQIGCQSGTDQIGVQWHCDINGVNVPIELQALSKATTNQCIIRQAFFTGTLKTVEGGTEAAFEVEANLRGRLAQFGGPVITATAKKLTAEFAKNLRVQLEKNSASSAEDGDVSGE
jgi:hypothetical protein